MSSEFPDFDYFTTNDGWLTRLKKRYGARQWRKTFADTNSAKNFKQTVRVIIDQ